MSGLASRRAALRILNEVRDGRPFDAALDEAITGLPDADRRLAHELAAGVLRTQSALDQRLAPLAARGWQRVDPPLREVLRLGAYQLTELDRIPRHAAVDTSVTLGRETAGAKAAGFVNAVLRKLTDGGRKGDGRGTEREARGRGPSQSRPHSVPVPSERLALAYSHPEWLVRRWVDRFGAAETERLLEWNNRRPALVLQPARLGFEELDRLLTEAGVEHQPAPFGAGIIITGGARPADLPGYDDGAFVVQDPAQAIVAWFADLPPEAAVYDACAAPGGKSIALGRHARAVISADRAPARVQRLATNLQRAGSGREHAIVADALHPPVARADAVLLDAPCLGTGTFGRHPDARLRVDPGALATLAAQQRRLLDAAASAVRPGGLLVYSTCSLEPEEDAEQVERFLAAHRDFRREPAAELPERLLSPEGDLMILPQRHGMDGAFAARLRRVE